MGKIAFVFSGQGAQHPGMGKELYDQFASVRRLYDAAEKIRPGTLAQSFDGDMETLTQTENTQPCLYLADLGAALAMKECGVSPAAVAGFSLGEIPALAAAGAFSHEDGFAIACRRGALMAEAAKGMSTSMMAVVKLENDTVERIAAENKVYPVNYNCPGQLVVSGDSELLKKFADDIKAAGGRAIPLKVSSAFHSPYMDPAAAAFGEFLENLSAKPVKPDLPVISNMTAAPYGENVIGCMRDQINHPVRWEAGVRYLAGQGFDTFVEVGVGSTLKKLIEKTLPGVSAFAVETADEARAAAQAILAAE